jgi:dTDP-4-amino-4,6-dideoxygalactose transaminase
LQAAFLRVKLTCLDEWNSRRARIAAHYGDMLKGAGLSLPFVPDWATPAWHLYVIRLKERTYLTDQLDRNGVGWLIHYPLPPHLQGAYREMGLHEGSYPIAEQMAREVVSLPMGPHLTRAQASVAAEACRSAIPDVRPPYEQ